MTITIKLKTDNAAFQPPYDRYQEVQRILEQWVADGVGNSRPLRDINGNIVGTVKVTGK